MSIFPESEQRRIAADFGEPRLPLEVKRAIAGAEKAMARSRKRAEKGLCTKDIDRKSQVIYTIGISFGGVRLTRDIAKVFMSGRSQAVRIPMEFRFDTTEVLVVRKGDSLVLTPHRPMTWDRFFSEYACPDFKLDRSRAQQGQERNLFA